MSCLTVTSLFPLLRKWKVILGVHLGDTNKGEEDNFCVCKNNSRAARGLGDRCILGCPNENTNSAARGVGVVLGNWEKPISFVDLTAIFSSNEEYRYEAFKSDHAKNLKSRVFI